jgi:hypothetical protein
MTSTFAGLLLILLSQELKAFHLKTYSVPQPESASNSLEASAADLQYGGMSYHHTNEDLLS